MSGDLIGQVSYRHRGLIGFSKLLEVDLGQALPLELNTKWQNAPHDSVTYGFDGI